MKIFEDEANARQRASWYVLPLAAGLLFLVSLFLFWIKPPLAPADIAPVSTFPATSLLSTTTSTTLIPIVVTTEAFATFDSLELSSTSLP